RHTRFSRDWSSDVCSSDLASEATNMAQAPSLTPDALPAVTVPPLRNGALSAASAASEVSARGCSSLSTTVVPLRPSIVTGTISRSEERRVGKEGGGGGRRE